MCITVARAFPSTDAPSKTTAMPYRCTPPGSPNHDWGVVPSQSDSGCRAVNKMDTGIQPSSGYFTPVYTIARKPRPLKRDGTPMFAKDAPEEARHGSDYPSTEPEFLKEHELLHRAHTVFFLQDERARLARGEDPMAAENRSHRSW